MTSTRKTATVVGALFLTQTVAFIIAEQLITGVLKGPDYLTGIAAHANALTLGGLLAVVSGIRGRGHRSPAVSFAEAHQ